MPKQTEDPTPAAVPENNSESDKHVAAMAEMAGTPEATETLVSFCASQWGKKQDQAAGFRWFASKRGPARATRAVWRALLDDFLKRGSK